MTTTTSVPRYVGGRCGASDGFSVCTMPPHSSLEPHWDDATQHEWDDDDYDALDDDR